MTIIYNQGKKFKELKNTKKTTFSIIVYNITITKNASNYKIQNKNYTLELFGV